MRGDPPVCHPERPHAARGLCRSCYVSAWRVDSLVDCERRTWPTGELVRQAERLRGELGGPAHAVGQRPSDRGVTWSEVAALLGVRPRTLEQARTRVHRQQREGS